MDDIWPGVVFEEGDVDGGPFYEEPAGPYYEKPAVMRYEYGGELGASSCSTAYMEPKLTCEVTLMSHPAQSVPGREAQVASPASGSGSGARLVQPHLKTEPNGLPSAAYSCSLTGSSSGRAVGRSHCLVMCQRMKPPNDTRASLALHRRPGDRPAAAALQPRHRVWLQRCGPPGQQRGRQLRPAVPNARLYAGGGGAAGTGGGPCACSGGGGSCGRVGGDARRRVCCCLLHPDAVRTPSTSVVDPIADHNILQPDGCNLVHSEVMQQSVSVSVSIGCTS